MHDAIGLDKVFVYMYVHYHSEPHQNKCYIHTSAAILDVLLPRLN